MHCLPYLVSVNDTEITIGKLDKVAKTLSDKIKSVAKLFGILISWCIFNLIVSLFFNRTRSLSLDTYRMINEGLRSLANQDVLFVLTFIFDDKLSCIISLAMIFAFGVAFFVCVLNLANDGVTNVDVNKREKSAHICVQSEAYVVSYKQQVAFLA